MQKENAKVIVKLVCFPGEFLSGVSRFFVSDGKISVRSKIGRCRFFRRPQDRQNTDFNVGLTPDLHAKQRGFTLIELLVVVLIIGILAAVALPQYQKAVWKSYLSTIKNIANSVANAQEVYYLANGQYATEFESLAVELPAGKKDTSTNSHYDYDWGSCQLEIDSDGALGINCIRNKGEDSIAYIRYFTYGPNYTVCQGAQNTIQAKVCQQDTQKTTCSLWGTVTTCFY